MMKIEQCIEDFMNSIVKRDAELFCSLLCPNSLSRIRKRMYTNKKYKSINRFVKEQYLDKLTRLVAPIYKYDYFKDGNKYIVSYRFPQNNTYLKTVFIIYASDPTLLINLDINKVQVKVHYNTQL